MLSGLYIQLLLKEGSPFMVYLRVDLNVHVVRMMMLELSWSCLYRLEDLVALNEGTYDHQQLNYL